ncbi:MAG: leucine-rich repeat domain-containing protein [Candidatus Latescibacteria bacterium]|nr:leucine-rich repeat domain-containing protein [Candidatus Latescibacterota bacterium]
MSKKKDPAARFTKHNGNDASFGRIVAHRLRRTFALLLRPVGIALVAVALPAASGTAYAQTDKDALVALYNATDGANWDTNTNWNSSAAIDTWYGVRTDAAGRVDSLNLRNNSLSGSIPAELGDLTNLKYLALNNNSLSGSIPAELGDLTNLRELYLHENNLTGPIPAELGNLTKLETLDLRDNKENRNGGLTGSIPAELGDLTNLKELNLFNNSLTGSIPAELGDLTNLNRLVLNSNALTGSIPAELGDLDSLKHLDLSDNSLSGSIPAKLGDLTNLQFLYLNRNDLTGSIPTEFINLSELEYLRVSSERCVPGDTAFQEWLGDLEQHLHCFRAGGSNQDSPRGRRARYR